MQPAASELQSWRLSWAVLRNLCCIPGDAMPALLRTGSFVSDARTLLQQLLQRKDSSRLAHVLAALTNLAANRAGQRQLLQSGALGCLMFIAWWADCRSQALSMQSHLAAGITELAVTALQLRSNFACTAAAFLLSNLAQWPDAGSTVLAQPEALHSLVDVLGRADSHAAAACHAASCMCKLASQNDRVRRLHVLHICTVMITIMQA